jgi:tetratricopeptide (TPR) repeat protein
LALVIVLITIIYFWQANLDLAAYYLSEGDHYQYSERRNLPAIAQYQMALRYGNDPEIYYQLAQVYTKQGNTTLAIEALENALEWNYQPRQRVLRQLITLYRQTNRHAAANRLQAELAELLN